MSPAPANTFRQATPIFPVANLTAAIDHYINVLALEMQVEDPDDNVLRFGSDSLKGQPFGEFLDKHGQLWQTA